MQPLPSLIHGMLLLESLSVVLILIFSLLLGSLFSLSPCIFPSVFYFTFSNSCAFAFVSEVNFNFSKSPKIFHETKVNLNKQTNKYIYTGSAPSVRPI